ncbi:MAG: carboxypeptidase-like regulatory domain-containing protein, partial [Longimicrobiales bacterium]
MATTKSIGLLAIWAIATLLSAAAPARADGASTMEQAKPGGLLARRSHLRVERVPLAAALQELTRSSGVSLAYSPSMLPLQKRVSCACAALSVGDALGTLLVDTGFQYREGDVEVILSPTPMPVFPAPSADLAPSNGAALSVPRGLRYDEPLPLLEVRQPALVRAARITGTVTSEGGSPVVGALVTSLRTRLSATTDNAGNYRIVVPTERIVAGPDTLRVERIGFSSANVAYDLRDGDLRVDAVLALQAVPLEQILVTGTAG